MSPQKPMAGLHVPTLPRCCLGPSLSFKSLSQDSKHRQCLYSSGPRESQCAMMQGVVALQQLTEQPRTDFSCICVNKSAKFHL